MWAQGLASPVLRLAWTARFRTATLRDASLGKVAVMARLSAVFAATYLGGFVLLDLVIDAVTHTAGAARNPGDGLWAQQAFWLLVDAWLARMIWLRHSRAWVIARPSSRSRSRSCSRGSGSAAATLPSSRS